MFRFIHSSFGTLGAVKVSFDEGPPNVAGVTPAGQQRMEGLASEHFCCRKKLMAWLIALQTVELADVARSI